MTKALTQLKENETGTVIQINGGVNVINRLNSLGIMPGRKITKVSSMMIKGPVTVQVNRSHIAIGYGMAEKIVVQVE